MTTLWLIGLLFTVGMNDPDELKKNDINPFWFIVGLTVSWPLVLGSQVHARFFKDKK